MIAKHLSDAKNAAGKMAEAAAHTRKDYNLAHEFGALAVKIDALMREAVELMAK